MTDFASDFRKVNALGLSAEQFFYHKVYEAFCNNIENDTLPFFNQNLNQIPREVSTGKIINNENTIALEQVASMCGYKSNLWIYGSELNKIQKDVGSLFYKKKATPVVCLTKYQNYARTLEDLNVADGGTGKAEQYLYNLDSLDERSKEKVLKYFGFSNDFNQEYVNQNRKAFQENLNNKTPQWTEKLENAKNRTLAASIQKEVDLRAITHCHYVHTLSNSIGNQKFKDKNELNKSHCLEAAAKLNEKVRIGELKEWQAGRALCTALAAGTEFQRVCVAKGYNLENAKIVEEMLVAEKNRAPYGSHRKTSYGYN